MRCLSVMGLWLLMLTPVLAEDDRLVTLVLDEAYPPYMMSTENGPAGIYADILREAARRLPQYRLQLDALHWSRAQHMVSQGRIDGLVGTYHRPQQRPWIRHYSTPLANEAVAVFCRDGIAQENWRFPQDFAGLLFSNNDGFAAAGAAFFDMVNKGEIAVIEEQTTEENLRLLHLGRADCYVQERSAAERVLRDNGYSTIRAVRDVLTETAHIGYGEHFTGADADGFIAEMDRVLQDMTDDGTIGAILGRALDGQ